MEKEKIQLFEKKEDCCACGACMNICPKKAIVMSEDEYGFMYPVIDETKCIKCGMCKSVCSYQRGVEMSTPLDSYVVVNKDDEQLGKSASGGVFSALGSAVLQAGGIVYGAAYDENMQVSHIRIDSVDMLYRLQGSKYVQSMIGFSYKNVKQDLEKGYTVLFSGTPCQIAGVKGFLNKDYDNLITIDLVCHGVPNQKMFSNYIDYLEKKKKGKIEYFNFRDKSKGWADYYIKISYQKKNRVKNEQIHCRVSAYYELFLSAMIDRENCYSCKYARAQRVSDITIGDYWGIEHQHKELFNEEKWRKRRYSGISCAMVNTEKGKKLFSEVSDRLEVVASTFDKVSAENGQLKFPSKKPEQRERIIQLFNEKGYAEVEKRFFKYIGKRRYIDNVKSLIPLKIKKIVKCMLE